MKALSVREKKSESSLYDYLRAGCLAPQLIQDLVEGKSSPVVGLENFKEGFPLGWERQTMYVPES